MMAQSVSFLVDLAHGEPYNVTMFNIIEAQQKLKQLRGLVIYLEGIVRELPTTGIVFPCFCSLGNKIENLCGFLQCMTIFNIKNSQVSPATQP